MFSLRDTFETSENFLSVYKDALKLMSLGNTCTSTLHVFGIVVIHSRVMLEIVCKCATFEIDWIMVC